jgi:hypothetical protein
MSKELELVTPTKAHESLNDALTKAIAEHHHLSVIEIFAIHARLLGCIATALPKTFSQYDIWQTVFKNFQEGNREAFLANTEEAGHG